MRALLLALTLAGLFVLALWWQERHWAGIRAEQNALAARQDALEAPTPSGTLSAGQAVLIVGSPSGAEPVARPTPPRGAPRPKAQPQTSSGDPDQPLHEGPLPEFELVVQPGQTLSGLAHLHYGRHGRELLAALARHNGLSDPHQLRAGAVLRLPPIEALLPGER